MLAFAIIRAILGILGILTAIWMMIGVPAGVVLLILYLSSKDKNNKKKLLKWLKVCFLSVIVLIIVFVLWAIVSFVGTLMGINPVFINPLS